MRCFHTATRCLVARRSDGCRFDERSSKQRIEYRPLIVVRVVYITWEGLACTTIFGSLRRSFGVVAGALEAAAIFRVSSIS
jgi:hypothetical protein